MWDEITYPFPNLNGVTVAVWEWICICIPHFIMDVIYYPHGYVMKPIFHLVNIQRIPRLRYLVKTRNVGMQTGCHHGAWWRHQMETFSAILALCEGNSPVTGEFPSQRLVTRSIDIFFYLRLNKQLSKQSWGWWFETPSRSLWRHCNGTPGWPHQQVMAYSIGMQTGCHPGVHLIDHTGTLWHIV